MKPAAFAYERPASVDEALAALAAAGEDGKVLAGGQSLVPLLNFRLARPAVLVDVNRVEALSYVRRSGGTLHVGALTRQADLERSPVARAGWPLLGRALRHVAHPQIRNRGTVGGSLAHADPAAELPVALAALDGRLHVRSRRGDRVLGWDEFFVSHLTSALAPDELLVDIEVPPMRPGSGAEFVEFARRHGDFALGGAAAVVTLDGDGRCTRAAIALLAAAPTPLRAPAAEALLAGTRLQEEAVAEAAATAVCDIDPVGDIHGSAGYRRLLIRALVARAVAGAAERARAAA